MKTLFLRISNNMKRIAIIIAACLFNSLVASADCSSGGIYVARGSEKLYKNSILILEFYAMSQEVVPGIGNRYLVWLQSGNAKVAMQPIEVLKGEMDITQVVFRPTCDLVEGEVYKLVIDSLSEWHIPHRYNSTTGNREPYSFTILKNTAIDLPLLFTKAPVETKKELILMGCGPLRSVHFSIVADTSIRLVRASVKNNYTGKTTIYILPIENGEVSVGHGMCSGPFLFDKGEKLTVSFALLDYTGNAGKYSAPISFTKPVLESR
jgi:hypothetical protein